ncbi:MAG: MFS transporter [Gammaproteobacteria bacterium]|nr:MFS transporter [Gammaproteobacteria bacterium]
MGKVLCEGGLVIFASLFFLKWGVHTGWTFAFLLLSTFIFLLSLYHFKVIPKELGNDQVIRFKKIYAEVIREFLQLAYLRWTILFIFIYHFAENQLSKIVPLFLLDKNGLNLSTTQVGVINGALATVAMLAGILLSSAILRRISLNRCLVPITVFAGITNIGYVLLSLYTIQNIYWVALILSMAQFGFGLANGAYLLFLLHSFGVGKYPMSMYAVGTALMGLSVTIGGALSGYIQYWSGYQGFFLWILFLSVVVIIFSIFLIRKENIVAHTI